MKNYLAFAICANYNKKLFDEMDLKDDQAYEICLFIAENALLENKDISYDEFMEYLEKVDFNLIKAICDTPYAENKKQSLEILENFVHENYQVDGEGNVDVVAGIISYAMTLDSGKDLFEYLCIALPFVPKKLLTKVSKYNPFNEENSSVFISVDERMPDTYETVLIRFKDNDCNFGFVGNDGKTRYELSYERDEDDSFVTSIGSYSKRVVDAWMPLPTKE